MINEDKEKAAVSTGVETTTVNGYLLYEDSLPQKSENINNTIITKKNRPFVMIDKDVLLSENLSSYEKLIYSILSAFSDKNDKTCYPSYETIAKKAGCKRRKAIDILTRLVAKGLVKKELRNTSAGFHRSNVYTVLVPSDGALSALPCGAGQTPGSACDTPPSASYAPKQDTHNYNQLNYIHLSNLTDEMDRLKTDIEYEFFKENMLDKLLFIDSLMGYIIELRQENAIVYQNLLSNLNSCIIMEFLDEMRGKSFTNVQNINKYMKRTFVEFLRAREMQLATI